jgi:hypothetical protein
MTLKTVQVQLALTAGDGSAVSGARVVAQLINAVTQQASTDVDTATGLVISSADITGVTDSSGLLTFTLWPNALGSRGTQYMLTATAGGNLLMRNAISVPDAAAGQVVQVSAIINNAPFPAVDAAQQAVAQAQQILITVQASAAAAATSASNASASESAALGSALAAAGSEAAAGASEGQAADSAALALAAKAAIDSRLYPGGYTSDPTTRPDGTACQVGDEFFHSTLGIVKRRGSSGWLASDLSSANLSATSGSSLVGYDGGTAQDVLDAAKPLATYTALRAYTGRATGVRITKTGISGHFYRDDTDTSAADNGGTVIVDGAGRRWKRLNIGAVDLAWFEPAGDGTTDDTTALQKWTAAAGINAVLWMPPGKTYLVSSTVALLSGQTLLANGSTIKRAAQRVTTTTATVTAGTTTSFGVTSGAALRQGDMVSISDSDGVARYHYTATRVAAISGNTITFTSAPTMGAASLADLGEAPYGGASGTASASNYTFPVGSKVAACWPTLDVVTRCTVRQLKLDGNKAAQQVAYWENMAEIRVNATNHILLDRVEVANFAGEAIIEAAGVSGPYAPANNYAGLISADETASCVGSVYNECRITNGRGNGIHLSAINIPKVLGGFFYDLNQDVSVGHVGGAVCLSWVGQHLRVEGIYAERCYAGVGPFNNRSSSYAKVVNCTFKDCVYPVNNQGLSSNYPGTQQLIVSDCHFNNCGYLAAASWQTATMPGSEVTFHHNFLSGTAILVDTIGNGMVDHNTIRNDYFVPLQCSGAVASNATTLTVADTSTFAVNQMIFLARNGARSGNFQIVSKTGTVLTLDRAVGLAFASAPWIYDTERMPFTSVISGTVITSGATTTYPVEDATLFRVNQWATLSQVNAGSATNASRVLAVDTVSSPNTITVRTASNRSWTAGTGTSAVRVWPSVFSCDGVTSIQATRGECMVDTNIVVGGAMGIYLQTGKGTAKGSKFRGYGVMTDSASLDRVFDNEITFDSAYTASWGLGLWARSTGKAHITNNEITAATTSHTCAQVDGARSIVDGNTFRAASGASAGKSLTMTGATYGEVRGNFTTVAFTGTAASRTTSENVESGTVVLA